MMLFRQYDLLIPEDTFASQVTAPDSIQSACQMVVEAEIKNVAMYDRFLQFIQEPVLLETFSQLREVS